jgi:tetratricopeptide (TPR) repeat protein
MTKETTEQPVVDVEQVYSRTERYIEENKRSLSIIVGAIIVIIGGYFAYTRLYVAPQNLEAQAQMFVAEQYFEQDSLDKALNGDGNYPGFIEIADEFSITPTGNLANYYAGICFLRKGDFTQAIEYLEKFESDDQVIGPIAVGAIGDAYMELKEVDEAIDHYLKAAKLQENDFTTPIYLMKAGLAYEEQGKYKEASAIYEQIKSDYPETSEGREVEKYIARAQAMNKEK